MIQIDELDVYIDENGELASRDVVFTHIDNADGTVRHFCVNRIQDWIDRQDYVEKVVTRTDPHFAQFAMVHRGVEKHRYDRITMDVIRDNPVIFAHIPGVGRDTEDQHLMIDGTHRYCKATLHYGLPEITGYTLRPEEWLPFLINLPPELNERVATEIKNQDVTPIDSRID